LQKKRKILFGAVIALLAAATVTAFLSGKRKEPVSDTRFMLDTICTVTLHDWKGDAQAVLDGAFELCGYYDGLLSVSSGGSDVYRINHSQGKPVEVSEETAALLRRALDYCALSEGEFDITIYPAKSLWNFNAEEASVPDAGALARASDLTDYTRLSVDGSTVTLPDGMGVDLGAIAKGFIADQLADYLRQEGVTSAVIDLGGNVYVIGKKPDGTDWKVGIKMPFADTYADIVPASDVSVVTSGVYQRCFEEQGRLYHHILRSSDGMPCDTGLYSVTVISQSSEQCDALSTMCMLLGYEKSLELLGKFSDVRAVFITSDKERLYYGTVQN
jgi:Membrane-associated lipoprotein involved in thiamine biosynthesis